MPVRKINNYTRRLIIHLRLKGMRCIDIAEKAHVHLSTVSRICAEERIPDPHIPRGRTGGRPQGSKSTKRATTAPTGITPHHDIVMLARQGYTIGDIAVAFSISLDEVNRRIREHLLYMRISKTPTSAD